MSTAKDDIIRCKCCDAIYHKKCVKDIKLFIKREMCECCIKSENKSPSTPLDRASKSESTDINLTVVLADVNKKLEVLYDMKKKLEELTDLVDFYSEKYQTLMEFKDSAENKIKALEGRNIYLEKSVGSLEDRIQELEDKEKEKNIELSGLEKKKNENLNDIVALVARKLQVSSAEIESSARVGREKPESNKPQTVVVTLKSKSARDQWIKCRKTRLVNGDIYGTGSDVPIYINENLTKNKRTLLWETKNQLKGTYKYIWVQNGQILIKKSDEDKKILKIRTIKDIDHFLNTKRD